MSTMMQARERTECLVSRAAPLECYVCHRGFADAGRITAKTMVHGTFMLCEEHYPLQWIVKDRPPA